MAAEFRLRRVQRVFCTLACALVIAQIISPPPSAKASDSMHSCVVLNGGGTFCWGSNSFGQAGQSMTSSPFCSVTNENGQVTSSSCVLHAAPVVGVPSTSVVKNFVMGYGHTCCIADVGVLRCWGRNAEGQVGNGGASSSCAVGSSTVACVPAPTVISMDPVTRLSAGGWHTCASTEGKVLCWGWNTHGQVGDGTVGGNKPIPSAILGAAASDFFSISLSCGGMHSCVVASTGNLFCWGDNENGQIGDGTVITKTAPVLIASLIMSAVSAGTGHTCAITNSLSTKEGLLKCWGQNNYGQLGQGSTSSYSLTPTDVPGISSVVALSLGGWHTCAVNMDGRLYCWGLNDFGQLGLPPSSNAACGTAGSSLPCVMSPTQVAVGVSGVATGLYHTCAIVFGGTVSCWGLNVNGQLGVADTPTPTTVARKDLPTPVVLPAGSKAVISLWDSSRTGKVFRTTFRIFPANALVAGAKNVSAVVSFKLSTSGALPSGSSITIAYPDLFFKDAFAPTPAAIGSDLERVSLPVLDCSPPRT